MQTLQLATVRAMWDLVRGRRDARRELRMKLQAFVSQLRRLLGKKAAPAFTVEHESATPAPPVCTVQYIQHSCSQEFCMNV